MNINVWTYYKNCCPIRNTEWYDSSFSQKLNDITPKRNYKKMIESTFLKLIKDVSIRYKIIGEDIVNKDEVNWVIFVLDDTRDSPERIQMILDDFKLIEDIKKNNFKLIVAHALEFINISMRDEFKDNCIKLFSMLPPENLQVVFNSYDYTNSHHALNFRPYITHLDVFPYYMNILLENNHTFYPHKNFTYKMCIPLGALIGRSGKLDFIAELIDRDVIFNTDVLHTVNIVDEKGEREELNKEIYITKNKKIIEDNKRKIFKRKLFYETGKEVTGEVRANIWYQTPTQFLDSAVQLIIESRFGAASITEKTYRPLAAGQPFIWMAKEKLKPYLESLGYEFYSWIDYSFDNIQDDNKRMAAVCDEAKRLHTLPNLYDLVSENEDITIHNITNFKEHVSEHKEIYKLM